MSGPDSGIRLRPAGPGDLEVVTALAALTGPEAWSRTSLAVELAAVPPRVLLAEHAGQSVGFVHWRQTGPEAELLSLAVAVPHRRRGVAAALLAAMKDTLRAAGAEEVFLEVREHNPAARALYEAMGFAPVGRRPGYYHNPDEAAVLYRAPL